MRRHTPRSEQEALLSKIRNPKQREALRSAIRRVEKIPDDARTPIPEDAAPEEVAELVRASVANRLEEHIEVYAGQARARSSEQSGYLCIPPITNCDLLGLATDSTPICGWGFFNPYGPTCCLFTLVHVPGTHERLIFLGTMHPFSTDGVIYGLLPPGVADDTEQLLAVLKRLFEQNGSDDSPLMDSLPTHVAADADGPTNKDQLEGLFALTARRIRVSENLGITCDRMLKFKGDPWGRIAAETEETMQLMDTYVRAERKGGPKAALDLLEEQRSSEASLRPTREQWHRWWSIVTDPEHVQSEMNEMQVAWDGALAFQRPNTQAAEEDSEDQDAIGKGGVSLRAVGRGCIEETDLVLESGFAYLIISGTRVLFPNSNRTLHEVLGDELIGKEIEYETNELGILTMFKTPGSDVEHEIHTPRHYLMFLPPGWLPGHS